MRCDALSLDLDDTVIDYSLSSVRALEAIGGRGSDLPLWSEVSAGVESDLNRGLLSVEEFERERIRRFYDVHYGRTLSGAEVGELVSVRRRSVLESVALFPDAVRFLRTVEMLGIKCIAVSNAFAELRQDIIDGLGLARHFVHMKFCGGGGVRKPDGESFSDGLGILGAEPGRVVHIGDEVDADVMGARNAGLSAVHVNRSGGGCSHVGACVPSLDVSLGRHEGDVVVQVGSKVRLTVGGRRDGTGRP